MSPDEPRATRITRIGHKKSRNGCLRCKQRHVKCDEQQPCHNCTRHNALCSLVQTRRAALPQAIASRGPAQTLARGRIRPHDAELTHNAHISPDWMRCLKLLNHYHTSTCLTLHHDAATLHMWRTVVTGLAVSHESLMHGLLALSALHYAHVHPDERKLYLRLSSDHQGRALEFFSTNLTNINDDNCEAYFVLSIIVFLLATWSIAHPVDRDEPVSLETVIQSFALTEGVKGVVEYPAQKKWSEGPLSPLFVQWETAPVDPSLPFAKRLEQLSALIQTISSDDISSVGLCRAGLESLRRAYALHRSAYSGRHRIWMWPVELGKQRFDFTSRHPIAVIILAHCAALVRCTEGPSWLWDGWGESVVHMAERELAQEWQPWLQWPLRCIRDALEVDAMGD